MRWMYDPGMGIRTFLHVLPLSLAVAAGVPGHAAFAQARSDGTSSGIASSQLAEGIYQFTASFDGYVSATNSVVVVGDDGVLVYDTFTRPSEARELLRMIRGITPLPVKYVVNSHWHPDHWTGNEVFADAFPGVQFVATARTAEHMRNVAPAWFTTFGNHLARMEKERAARTDPLAPEKDAEELMQIGFLREAVAVRRTYPTLTYRGEMALRLGDREVRLATVQGDASDTTMIYLPRERIAAVGDVLVHPMTWDANRYEMSTWLDSLRDLERMDVAMIVPGHGVLLRDKTYIALVIELFQAIRGQVQAALRDGAVAPDDAVAALSLGGLRERFARLGPGAAEEFDAYAPEIARKFYQELRDGMISKR
jgi:cyclase